jgi:hypothetical protein
MSSGRKKAHVEIKSTRARRKKETVKRVKTSTAMRSIQDELLRYSAANGYRADYFADAVCCECEGKTFLLLIDDAVGAAVRRCVSCNEDHPICDSEAVVASAELEECSCPCENETFEIVVGVSLYRESEDVRWLYLGCRCISCGLIATYGDWKNEFIGFQKLLMLV